jgi:glycosyltransferase involved in cell wall biosynthesis
VKTGEPIKIGVQQRVLPSYRVSFFDALAESCGGLSVFAGDPRKNEALDTGAMPDKAQYYHAHNVHLFRGSLYNCWQVNILRWLNEWQPQVLIMEANPRYPCSYQALRWMKQHGGKVIGWGLGSPIPSKPLVDLRLYMRKRFIHRFDALITYSRTGSREYAHLGFNEKRIFNAPNAVAPKPVHPLPERMLQYSQGKPVVLFVGRLQARKRVDALIRACAQMPVEEQPFLWIVGDGPMRRDLESLAGEIYPSAKFYGAQHGSELELLLRGADLFVLPGTGGLAVQQAMSFGLPVIVGIADGTQSELVREQNGWILNDDSTAYLSRTIQNALRDIEKLRAMGAESYRIVSQDVNLEKMVAVFMQTVHSVLED